MLDALLPDASSPGTSRPTSRVVAEPACPSWLTPVQDLVEAHLCASRGRSNSGAFEGSTVARKEGKRFESKVLDSLRERFPFLQVEPGFGFRDRFGPRICYPDALLRFNDSTVIVEIKHRGHQLGDAWWQLTRYYRPVVEAIYPADPVLCLAIVRGYDPSVRVPGATFLAGWEHFRDWRATVADGPFGVMSWDH
jgi:hypothetical protein